MSSKIINLSLPADLVKKIDAAAKSNYATRSDFIRESVVRRLRREAYEAEYPITTEWDDGSGETWRKVVDFRDKDHPDGMSAAEVSAIFKKAEEYDRQSRQTTPKRPRQRKATARGSQRPASK